MKFCVQIKSAFFCSFAFVCLTAAIVAGETSNVKQTQNESAVSDTVGKLYVLNVWGTNASDYKTFLDCMANQFDPTMWGSGLKPDSEYLGENGTGKKVDFCAEFITLLGKDSYERERKSREYCITNGIVKDYSNQIDIATNKNVLDKCRYISQKAGKNDVIFVYMCCHAKTAKLDGDNKRYHILFPGIKELSEMENNENGIKRSDIIQTLNPNKHRLIVLITDSSARPVDSPVLFPPPNTPSSIWEFQNNRLWLLLRKNTGLIDWNSTSPFGGYDKQGELASFFQPYSIFDQAFFYAFEEIDPEINSISTSDFFNGLKEKLATKFKYYQKNDQTENGIEIIKTGCAAFDNQPTQTLFDFQGLGYVTDKDAATGKVPVTRNYHPRFNHRPRFRLFNRRASNEVIKFWK